MFFPRPRTAVLLGAALLTLGVALGVLSLPSGAAAPEDAAAARAVIALTEQSAEQARTAMPENFATVEGYRPVVRGHVLLRPDGSCSSSLPLPGAFGPICDRHDLGYDLLRYAAANGRPLGPWARKAIDSQLRTGLEATCAAATGAACRLTADLASAVVVANSLRQGEGVPGPETAATVGAVMLGGGGTASLVAVPVMLLLGRLGGALRGGWRRRTRGRSRPLRATPVSVLVGTAVGASPGLQP